MSDADFLSLAAALFDGGWRSGDAVELVSYYGFDHVFALRLCEKFLEFEKKEVSL